MNEQLQGAREALARLAGSAFDSLDDASLCALAGDLEQLGRLLDASRALAAAEIDERSRYELGTAGLAQRSGHARGSHLIERLTRVPQAEATRRIRLGSALRPRRGLRGDVLPATFPAVAASVRGGVMGLDAAAIIIQCLTQAQRRHATPAAVLAAEESLVEAARLEPADLVAVQARVWREALDPDGAQPRDAELRERRGFFLGRERNGMTPFSGSADPASAALLRAALAERSGPGVKPRFVDPTDTITDAVTVLTDPRTPEQRNFDIVVGLLTAGLRSSEGQPGSMRATSTVMAVIQLGDLESGSGVGWLDDIDEPVAASTVQTMACDAGFARIVLGADGEVLQLGRTERLFSPAQRRALAVRDGGCVWPQCTAPPSWCHAHHVTPWSQGGDTDVGNGALLCPAHHHMLHASDFEMRMIEGRPHLLSPPWLDADRLWRPAGRARVTMTAWRD
jgi:hypothetical protein